MNSPELRPSTTKPPAATGANDDLRTRIQKSTIERDRLAASGLNIAGLGKGGPSMRESLLGAKRDGEIPESDWDGSQLDSSMDHNSTCNTICVTNLPPDASEDDLKAIFSKERGFKRLCFRNKQNGPVCFVEFENVDFAVYTFLFLDEDLPNGIIAHAQLGFAKQPLGVRSVHPIVMPGSVKVADKAQLHHGEANPGYEALQLQPDSSLVASLERKFQDDLTNAFNSFAADQRRRLEETRSVRAKNDQVTKLNDLKKFGSNFKLHTPVPVDLLPIICKDPAEERQSREKIKNNAKSAEANTNTQNVGLLSLNPPHSQVGTSGNDTLRIYFRGLTHHIPFPANTVAHLSIQDITTTVVKRFQLQSSSTLKFFHRSNPQLTGSRVDSGYKFKSGEFLECVLHSEEDIARGNIASASESDFLDPVFDNTSVIMSDTEATENEIFPHTSTAGGHPSLEPELDEEQKGVLELTKSGGEHSDPKSMNRTSDYRASVAGWKSSGYHIGSSTHRTTKSSLGTGRGGRGTRYPMPNESSKGKGVDRSSAWSQWTWDDRGYYYSSRYGPSGELVWAFRYPEAKTPQQEQRTPRSPGENVFLSGSSAGTFSSSGANNEGCDTQEGLSSGVAQKASANTTTQPQHIGRWGRNGPIGHSSLFDTEAPFPSSTKSKVKTPSPPDNEDDAEIIGPEDEFLSQSVAEQRIDERQAKQFRLSHQQTEFLLKEFKQQPNPDAAYRDRLSKEIPGITPEQVQVWFENRRAKNFRQSADEIKHLRNLTRKEIKRLTDLKESEDNAISQRSHPVPESTPTRDHQTKASRSKDMAGDDETHSSRHEDDDYYYRRDVRETNRPTRDAEEDFGMARYDRRYMRPRDSVSDESYSDEDYYVHGRVVRQRSRSRGSPDHKRHLAEGALAGAGAAALFANHREKTSDGPEYRGRNVVGGAALGALSAEVITRARSRYRKTERSRSRSRSESISRHDHHTKLKTALGLAAAAKAVSNREASQEADLDSHNSQSTSRYPTPEENFLDRGGLSLGLPSIPHGIRTLALKAPPTPRTLQEGAAKGDFTFVFLLLKEYFDLVANDEFEWLRELSDIDCSHEEMTRILIDGEANLPWLFIDEPLKITSTMIPNLHQKNCVHHGGYEVAVFPKIRHSRPNSLLATEAKGVVSEYCGLAGIVPLRANTPHESCVQFEKGNSTALISYQDRYRGFYDSGIQRSRVSQMLEDLDRIFHVLGFLQEEGLCCDAITILRITNATGPIELCKVKFTLLTTFRVALGVWEMKEDVQNVECRQACEREARRILDVFVGAAAAARPYSWDDCFSVVLQCLFTAILSYIQAHVGSVHPTYLVNELREIRLFGIRTQTAESAHVVVELLDFTCVKEMVEDSALVFRSSEIPATRYGTRFDLLASPEDIADTWGPARFVTDPHLGPRALHAIEIGGGTISRPSDDSDNLHWARGQKAFGSYSKAFGSTRKMLIAGISINIQCPLDETKSWLHPATSAYLKNLGTYDSSWELREKQAGFQGGQYAVLAFNATYIKQNGVTLKQRQLMLPFNEIDLAFLDSSCGLQVSLCTGVARRVPLRVLLADVMEAFVESRVSSKPLNWEELKSKDKMIQSFRTCNLELWFNSLSTEKRESAIYIVRRMLEVLKDTGIDKNGEELVIAWVRKGSSDSCFRLRCEKTSLWARILADSEDCATFACITPLCLQSEKHKCRHLEAAPWHNVGNLLDTAVCPQLSNRELTTVATTLVPFKLQHQVSYWIGKSGSNMIAKVWLTTEDAEPVLVVRQKVIPEKYRARMPKSMVDRLGRLRERQASETIAKQVMILTEMPI